MVAVTVMATIASICGGVYLDSAWAGVGLWATFCFIFLLSVEN